MNPNPAGPLSVATILLALFLILLGCNYVFSLSFQAFHIVLGCVAIGAGILLFLRK